jgi:hypothetical protein
MVSPRWYTFSAGLWRLAIYQPGPGSSAMFCLSSSDTGIGITGGAGEHLDRSSTRRVHRISAAVTIGRHGIGRPDAQVQLQRREARFEHLHVIGRRHGDVTHAFRDLALRIHQIVESVFEGLQCRKRGNEQLHGSTS